MKFNRKAQQIIEYLLLITAVVLGALALANKQGPLRHVVEHSLGKAVDTIYKEYAWHLELTGFCDVPCGIGTEPVNYTCVDGGGAVVADSLCEEDEPKPGTSISCDEGDCSIYQWVGLGDWTPCSNPCGTGTTTETILCRANIDGELVDFEDMFCLQTTPKPNPQSSCTGTTSCVCINMPVNASACAGTQTTGVGVNTPWILVGPTGCTVGGQCEAQCIPGAFINGSECALYLCSGAQPANSTACINTTTGLPGPTAWSLGNCNGKCQAVCSIGYFNSNGVCTAYQCSGSQPANSIACTGTTTGLTGPTAWSVGNCTGKCQGQCRTGYFNNGGVCEAYVCTGTMPANSTSCPGTATGLNGSMPWSLGDCSGKCQSQCNSGYFVNNGICRPYQCSGTQPVGTTACPGTTTGLTGPTSWSLGDCSGKCQARYQCSGNQPTNSTQCSGTTTGLTGPAAWSLGNCSGKCQAQCNAGYFVNNGACITYQCSGTQPFGSISCPGTTTGLTGPTSWSLGDCSGKCQARYQCSGNQPANSTQCSGATTGLTGPASWSLGNCNGKCQAQCNSGYVSNNGACVQYQCSGNQPANSTQCSGTTTGLTGPTTWSVGTCNGKCQARCNSGYFNNGGVCALYQCSGNQPTHSTQCSGTTTGLTGPTTWSVGTCNGKCQARCNSGYFNNGGVCALYQCSGNQPANSNACPATTTGLTGPTTWSLGNCSGKCQAQCSPGYLLYQGNCVRQKTCNLGPYDDHVCDGNRITTARVANFNACRNLCQSYANVGCCTYNSGNCVVGAGTSFDADCNGCDTYRCQ